ncbi:hypothetical protein BLNAU_23256 [Blattamonas nauphoetae]|uniref:Right handed beta helix domain-containing protein n=1 Tax=Blattamonas nauphoetae TaxID=2049346 RepID=A0ABQ9WQT6_9EUKA|nr:hypothetical protein BLNAU_23256 [Blattamonas nauphoetae]
MDSFKIIGTNGPGTRIVPLYESDRKWSEEIDNIQAYGHPMFSLTNSTLSLKWMDFSLVDSSEEGRQENNEARSPKLAIVSGSMLTISESRIEVSPWISAIVISGSALEESGRESSVVISKSLMWNDVGSMRGVVETSSFSSIGGSISVSIVGCSFDSSQILGNDGLALTDTVSSKECGIGWKIVVIADWMLVCEHEFDWVFTPITPAAFGSEDVGMCCIADKLAFVGIDDSGREHCLVSFVLEFFLLLSSPPQHQHRHQRRTVLHSQRICRMEPLRHQSPSLTATSPVPNINRVVARSPSTTTLASLSLSNSFTNTVQTFGAGGAVYINPHLTVPSSIVRVESCNFTDCSARWYGGSLYLYSNATVTLTGCRSVGCSATVHAASSGGGMYIALYNSLGSTVSDMSFKDCWTGGKGGGSYVYALCPLSLTDCEFINCKTTNPPTFDSTGGGLCAMTLSSTLTMEGCQFIDCSSNLKGRAVVGDVGGFVMSDCLVKNCHSTSSSAVVVFPRTTSPISLNNVLFVGINKEDTPTDSSTEQSTANNVQFADFEIRDVYNLNPTDISISDCYTTTTPNSVGMYARVFDYDTSILTYTRVDHDAFNKMGPYLTEQVEAKLDSVWRRLDVIVKGKVQLESQLYEVRLKETEKSAELTGELQFVNGVGSLLPSSNLNLKFSTAYTITSIVGVVPSSSSESNAIPITAEAWAFNLAATPDFVSFTTPDTPPCLTGTTAYLLSKEPEYSYIVVVFNDTVRGSLDIVVEERGKDVTITVEMNESAKTGESDKFVVVGDSRFLTHDTTYTIKSIVPTEGNESTTTPVLMIDSISFHIPKSSYVPPGKDDKKTMSPETKKLLSWLLPLVGCLLIALVLAIIVIVLLRRRQQKSTEPAQNEMEPQEQIDVEKVEEFGVDCSNGVIRTDDNHASSLNSGKENRPDNETEKQDPSQFGEVMVCNGDFAISTARMDSTLYSVLHKEHRDVWKRGVGLQIVNGLKHVVAHRGWSDVLTRLSSHWILIDGSGNVQLKLQMTREEAELEAAFAQMQNPQPPQTWSKT